MGKKKNERQGSWGNSYEDTHQGFGDGCTMRMITFFCIGWLLWQLPKSMR